MEHAAGGAGFAFGLGRSDGLRVYQGETLVEQLDWEGEDHPVGATYGRLPDGTGDWQSTAPTPEAPNEALDLEALPSMELFPEDRVMTVELVLSETAWDAILANPLAEEYQTGSIIFDGTRVDDVAIRVKGNSTLNSIARSDSERYSFKVDINRNIPGQRLRVRRNSTLTMASRTLTPRTYRLRSMRAPASRLREPLCGSSVAGQHAFYTRGASGRSIPREVAEANGGLYNQNLRLVSSCTEGQILKTTKIYAPKITRTLRITQHF